MTKPKIDRQQAGANPPAPIDPAEVGERLRAAIRSPAWAKHFELLKAAEASPAAKNLDILALKDLVSIEQWVPAESEHSDARKALEYCALARQAAGSMKANYWLRRAMVSAKDFMLWDDAIRGERFKGGKPAGSLEPIPKRVRDYLKRCPTASAAAVWDSIKQRPPKGFQLIDRTARVEPYVLKPDGSQMSWRRFQNVVSEHRSK